MSWPTAALFSLSDTTGAAAFARALAARGTRLVASGGTARHLEAAGLAVTRVEDWTGVPELLGGRVKTLHPHVHAPILARRDVAADLATLVERGLQPIDLVAVTLYPFEARAATLEEPAAIEEIDIGGVALLRAAAKNHASVVPIHDPAQYAEVLAALESGSAGPERRRAWAAATFARTARYDAAIAAELERRGATTTGPAEDAGAADAEAPPPASLSLTLELVRRLRYGENPHQHGAVYAPSGTGAALHALREGKELSYNNLLDVDAAVTLVHRFGPPACVVIKHGEPCGAASASNPLEAFEQALATDALSAYGGIVAFNRSMNGTTAERVAREFMECVVAPAFEPAAAAALATKKNLRVLELSAANVAPRGDWRLREVGPWWLVQREAAGRAPAWTVATSREPTLDETVALRFAWEIVAAARSNAVTIARGTQLVGLGSGQTSRVDAVDVALMKVRRAGHDPRGAALASDAFFPFADNIEHAAAAGITAIVQPGGSVRDAEVIAACDHHGIAMMFTGRRVFRH